MCVPWDVQHTGVKVGGKSVERVCTFSEAKFATLSVRLVKASERLSVKLYSLGKPLSYPVQTLYAFDMHNITHRVLFVPLGCIEGRQLIPFWI